jgi:uncharacterized protein (TIGR04255 family)
MTKRLPLPRLGGGGYASGPQDPTSRLEFRRETSAKMPRPTQLTYTAPLLPEYAKPPVVEVACSMQFEPIDKLHAGRLGLLWEGYRDRYPLVEQQPPLSPIREQFEATPMRLGFSFETFPMPRVWFLKPDGTRLVQVQRDHFIVNWRKLDTDVEYPRYVSIRETLIEELAHFQTFLEREGLGPIRVVQTELTYVNQIDARTADGSRKPLSQIVRVWSGDEAKGKLPRFEETSFHARYVMRDGDKPVGRLHINLEPQLLGKDNAPVYALTVVARGVPPTPDVDGALASLDRGHEAIVEGFTAITTDEMHAIWERQK